MINVIDPASIAAESVKNTKKRPVHQTRNRDMIQDFRTLFQDQVKKTTALEKNSSEMTQKMVAGDVEDIHQVMIAAEKAKVAFRFTLEIKNKIMSAYQELQRMQV